MVAVQASSAIAERLAARAVVDNDTGCHIWAGWKTRNGYGRIDVPGDGRWLKMATHRVAYELAKGPIPHGMQIDHLCRNRACCNPDHLEAVTLRENLARSWASRRLLGQERRQGPKPGTHCGRGHEFTPENTVSKRGGQTRACRACEARYKREAYARAKSLRAGAPA